MRSRLFILVVFVAGCLDNYGATPPGPDGGVGDPTPGPPPVGDAPPPPSDPPPPPPTPVYTRGSLKPLYELTPRAEYGRLTIDGVAMTDADFQTNAVTVSASQKMDEVAATIGAADLIPNAADRQRANFIPFRGNPSDVKSLVVGGRTRIYVPLGGDVMTPGNEVAVVEDGRVLTRIKVGIRPVRVAIHPAGLVFVCNQFSNYISIIDPNTNTLLTRNGQPVEIKTEYYCADLAIVPPSPQSLDVTKQVIYVANRWRHSVLKYRADVSRDPLNNRPIDVVQYAGAAPSPAHKPIAEILGVGRNPHRLSLNEQKNALYVANNKGGEVARVSLGSDIVTERIAINAPSADIVNIGDLVYVPTTMIDRGLLADGDQKPLEVVAGPVVVRGLDGKSQIAHPGAMFDRSRGYNFEDIRNGLLQLDFQLRDAAQAVYFTDNNSGEPNYANQQKVLAGALPTTVVRNAAGTSIFVAEGGSDIVQELTVNAGARPFTLTPRRSFRTGIRPYGLAIDEVARRLYVATWGGESLETFDLDSGNRLSVVDLGYAQPAYPATNIERGEFFFYNATWSNNRRKSCAGCHFDELDTDGVGYSNGATTPTAYHQVKPNHNLATTDSYFWNGSFRDGSYASLAFAAQTRTNCELITFGFTEGPASDPNQRVGDPNNRFRNANDARCRPQSAGLGKLNNQADINAVVAQTKAAAAQTIQQETGLSPVALGRVIDFYSVSELRLPPNPLTQLRKANLLDPVTKKEIEDGAALFKGSAECAKCHDPANTRHPFADGLNHGSGADWVQRFVNTYANDARVVNSIGAFSQKLLDAISPSVPDSEVNMHVQPLDFFIPFCFDVANCLAFDDPLVVRGNAAEEGRRLQQIIDVNLADPARQFIPGNVRGAIQVNTPSLRGVWTQANILHHGLGRTVNEAILGPGHPALAAGEKGWAVDGLGKFDVHGKTSQLTADQVRALVRYVENIE
jgi:DNA-binding beta-propeller fold protein YncE